MGKGGKDRGRGNWRPGGGGGGPELRSRPSLAAVGGGAPATRPSNSRESYNKDL